MPDRPRRFQLLALPILCVLMVVQACTGDQHASPTEVIGNVSPSTTPLSATSCPTPGAVDKQIIALVPVGKKIIAAVDFDVIVLAYDLGKKSQAQTAMFQLWSKVLAGYFANKLVGGMSTATQAAVLALGKAFYCSVGLDGSTLTLGSPADSNNVVVVVFPSTSTQTVVTPSGNAGVQIPPNVLTAPTTITINPIPGPFPEFTGPLNTKLDQFGPFFQFTAVPESSIGDTIVVSTCVSDPLLPVSRVHLAHNVGTGLEILPLVPTFLTCSPSAFAQPANPFQLARAHDYRGAMAAIGSQIGDLFVSEAFAGGTSLGIGGKTKSFSPFGVVDTLVMVQANSLTQQQAPTGSPVASPPSVLVQTIGAHTGLASVGVVFSIVQGTGDLTAVGSTTLVTQVSATTSAAGVASVGSWVVGLGSNIVNAIATYPAPVTGVGVSVTGNPVADTATGGDVIPYYGTNYKWLLASTGDTVGFFQPGFNDASWNVGNASFGSGDVPGITCPLDATVVTHWDNSIEPNAMLLRKTFQWPAAGTGQTILTLGVAIDNDIQVYVNGTDITSTVQGGTVSSDGYVHHENCATEDSFLFSVSDALLVAGNNLLAVRARDRSGVSYVDVRLSVPSPIQLEGVKKSSKLMSTPKLKGTK